MESKIADLRQYLIIWFNKCAIISPWHLWLSYRMKQVVVNQHKILLVWNKGEFSAVGGLCTHYGAPLIKGKVWLITPAVTSKNNKPCSVFTCTWQGRFVLWNSSFFTLNLFCRYDVSGYIVVWCCVITTIDVVNVQVLCLEIEFGAHFMGRVSIPKLEILKNFLDWTVCLSTRYCRKLW